MTDTLVYLDSSAIVKLVAAEAESGSLRAWLADHSDRVTSVIAHVEVRRALRRANASRSDLQRAAEIVDRIGLLALERAVIDLAARLDPSDLRSLDAIHLASALSLGTDLAGLVTYDARLAAAAQAARIEVWSPGA